MNPKPALNEYRPCRSQPGSYDFREAAAWGESRVGDSSEEEDIPHRGFRVLGDFGL